MHSQQNSAQQSSGLFAINNWSGCQYELLRKIQQFDDSSEVGNSEGFVAFSRRKASNNHSLVGQEVFFKQITLKALQSFKNYPQRLVLEIKISQKLTHPRIVKILDYGFLNNRPVIVTNLIRGVNLHYFLYKTNILMRNIPLIFSIARQLFKIVGYCHQNNIIHRDIKPENIMIEDGAFLPYFIDFGLSRHLLEEAQTERITKYIHRGTVGTEHFMAPEMIDFDTGKYLEYDESVDIYALGVTLYEMLTGRVPFWRDNTEKAKAQKKRGAFFVPKTWMPEIDTDMENFFRMVLHPNPKKRPRAIQATDKLLEIMQKHQIPLCNQQAIIDLDLHIQRHDTPVHQNRREKAKALAKKTKAKTIELAQKAKSKTIDLAKKAKASEIAKKAKVKAEKPIAWAKLNHTIILFGVLLLASIAVVSLLISQRRPTPPTPKKESMKVQVNAGAPKGKPPLTLEKLQEKVLDSETEKAHIVMNNGMPYILIAKVKTTKILNSDVLCSASWGYKDPIIVQGNTITNVYISEGSLLFDQWKIWNESGTCSRTLHIRNRPQSHFKFKIKAIKKLVLSEGIVYFAAETEDDTRYIAYQNKRYIVKKILPKKTIKGYSLCETNESGLRVLDYQCWQLLPQEAAENTIKYFWFSEKHALVVALDSNTFNTVATLYKIKTTEE